MISESNGKEIPKSDTAEAVSRKSPESGFDNLPVEDAEPVKTKVVTRKRTKRKAVSDSAEAANNLEVGDNTGKNETAVAEKTTAKKRTVRKKRSKKEDSEPKTVMELFDNSEMSPAKEDRKEVESVRQSRGKKITAEAIPATIPDAVNPAVKEPTEVKKSVAARSGKKDEVKEQISVVTEDTAPSASGNTPQEESGSAITAKTDIPDSKAESKIENREPVNIEDTPGQPENVKADNQKSNIPDRADYSGDRNNRRNTRPQQNKSQQKNTRNNNTRNNNKQNGKRGNYRQNKDRDREDRKSVV